MKFLAVNFLFVFALEMKGRKQEWMGGQRKKEEMGRLFPGTKETERLDFCLLNS